MAYNAEGKWTPEDDSVSTKLTGLLKKDNSFMTAARTSGIKHANRRGLLNSSIAGQASEQAAISAALPIASQESSQIHAKNLTQQNLNSSEKIASQNVAAHDRQYVTGAVAEMQKKYGALLSEVIKNKDIPAVARNKYLAHASALRDSDLNMIEQLYNIDLDWTTASISI